MSTVIPKFPNAIATESWLTTATNQLQTRLAVPCGSADTTLGVVDASRIVQWSLLTLIDSTNGATAAGVSEIVLVTLPPSGNILTVQRGYDGSAAKSHGAGSIVNGYIVAWHQKVLAAEIKAIEQALGPNLANIGAGIPGVYVAESYAFAPQSPGVPLAPGNNVITLTPVPAGVNGTDTDHWLYIDQGTGTPEPVKITGGSAIGGSASGQLIVNCANTHSGAWRIGTATGGISEAIWAMPAGVGGHVVVSSGTIAIHAPIKRRTGMTIWVSGQGMETSILAIAADFPNAAAGVNAVFDWTPGDGRALCEGGAHDLSVHFIQPDSTNIALYTHWKPVVWTSTTYHTDWRNLMVVGAWDGFVIPTNTNGAQFCNIYGSFFGRMVVADQCFDSVRCENMHSATTGLTVNQGQAFLDPATNNVGFDVGRVDDLKIQNCTIGSKRGARFTAGSDGQGSVAYMSNFWSEGNITVTQGMVKIQSSHLVGSSSPVISQTGGQLFLDEVSMLYVGASVAIYSHVADDSKSAAGTYPPSFHMVNCRLDTQNFNAIGLGGVCEAPFTGPMNYLIANSLFYRHPEFAYTASTINIASGTGDARLTFTGNRFSSAGSTGNGPVITLVNNTRHVVVANDGGGFSLVLPAVQTNILAWPNNNFFGFVNPIITAKLLIAHQTENFIALETGAANAIAGALLDAGGAVVPYTAGLKVSILLAHPLQAGVNTMNLNGLGAKPIKSGRNPANNIATAYVAGAIFTGIYDGAQFLDVSQ